VKDKILQYLKERNEYLEERKLFKFGADRLIEENNATAREIERIVAEEELDQEIEERR
jgi:hypothetical protein